MKANFKKIPRHSAFGGDFIIIIAVILGFALTGGLSMRDTSVPTDQSMAQTIITQPVSNNQDSLQLQTFRVEQCSSTAAIDFLIDNSGSMQFGTKMQSLKNALTLFAGKFSPTGAIALQTYSVDVQDRVPFSYFKDVKQKFLDEVDAMKPLSATHSKDAFQKAQNALLQAKPKFPTYNFSLVFISDGIPETQAGDDACPGGQSSPSCSVHPLVNTACRCYDPDQDPSSIATQLKANGVHIYTIAFVDDADSHLNSKLQALMQDVASTPADYFQAPVDSQLDTIITHISTEVCSHY